MPLLFTTQQGESLLTEFGFEKDSVRIECFPTPIRFMVNHDDAMELSQILHDENIIHSLVV